MKCKCGCGGNTKGSNRFIFNHHTFGRLNGNWKGGVKIVNNRAFVLVSNNKYVARARLVMEKHIGRKLTSLEIIHHKNENPLDDRFENLQIMTMASHRAHHNKDKIGFKHSEETKRKMRELRPNFIPWNKGKALSKETRLKISKSSVGRVFSEESKQKMRKPKSLETRRRMTLAWIKRRKNAKNIS